MNPQAQSQPNQQTQPQQNQTSSGINAPSTSPYPMFDAPNQHIANLNRVTNSTLGVSSDPLPRVPELNYPLNILTATGNTLRNYYQALGKFIPLIEVLSESLQRESLITSPEERDKVKRLIVQIKQGLDEIVSSTGPVSTILQGLDFGNAPGQGMYRYIGQAEVALAIDIQGNNQNDSQNQSSVTIPNVTVAVNNAESGRRSTSSPFDQILSQMSQPQNMQMMMNMVGGMLGNQPGSSGASSSNAQANPFGNILNQLMNNLNGPGDAVPQSTQEFFANLMSNNQLRKTTIVKDIPPTAMVLDPQPDFKPLVEYVLSQLTVQEVIDIKSINFKGLTRLRKTIRDNLVNYLNSKLNADKNKLVNEIKDMILERLMNHENETDKIIRENFDTEDLYKNLITRILQILLDESISDIKFENSLRREFIMSFGELFDYLKSSYNTQDEGAYFYLDCNIEDLLCAILGKPAFDIFINLNENFIDDFTENLNSSYSAEKTKATEEVSAERRNNNDMVILSYIIFNI